MKFKNVLTILMVLSSLTFSFAVYAEEVTIPVIQKPSVLQEGTQRELTEAQVAELLPWAKNSRIFLKDLKNSLQGLSSADKLERLETGIATVVTESAPKNSELFMRYILNRSLVVNNILKAEMAGDEVGSIDTKLRVLSLSIDMAVKYYDKDMEVISKKMSAPFIEFGIEYFNFLTEVNKSVFDASASYNIQRTAMEWLQWDLYRDLNNQQMASQIVKINNSLKIYPAKKLTDAQYISFIKQMKLLAQSLELGNYRAPKKTVVNVVNDNVPDVIVSNGSNLSSGEKSKIVSQCASSFSSPEYRSSCVDYSIAYGVDSDLIKMCGSQLSTNAARYSCLTVVNGQASNWTNVKAYNTCGAVFSDNDYRVACMKSYNETSLLSENIQACGSQFSTNATRLDCVNLVGSQGRGENQVSSIRVCGSAMSDNGYRYSCLSYALSSPVTNDEIETCGAKLSTNSTRLDCIRIISENTVSQSTKIIKACGSVMSDNNYRNSCIELSASRKLSSSDINTCGAMTTNATRLSCLSNL